LFFLSPRRVARLLSSAARALRWMTTETDSRKSRRIVSLDLYCAHGSRMVHDHVGQNEPESRIPLGVSSVRGRDGRMENLSDVNADEC
jgi:hypothetical protein